MITELILATFTSPEQIGTNPQSVLWLLPLTMAISVIYKATKLPVIKTANFIKETAALCGSIIGFIIATAFVLYVLTWLIAL